MQKWKWSPYARPQVTDQEFPQCISLFQSIFFNKLKAATARKKERRARKREGGKEERRKGRRKGNKYSNIGR